MTNQSSSLDILLADDDEEDQELLKDAIVATAPGALVSIVNNGEQVLSYLEGNNPLPRIIVLDYKMPLLNGLETIERLCHDSRFSAIPVVIWSTSNRKEYVESCMQKGATKFYTKPNDPKELKTIVAGLLSLARTGV